MKVVRDDHYNIIPKKISSLFIPGIETFLAEVFGTKLKLVDNKNVLKLNILQLLSASMLACEFFRCVVNN